MDIGVLSVKSLSAESLSQELGASHWGKRSAMPAATNLLIRWGSTALGPKAELTLNSAQAINKAADKMLCREILKMEGIEVPEPGHDKLPCIGRTMKHRAGNGLWYCETKEEVRKALEEGAKYFSQFYPKTTEYRVHIGGGKVVLYSQKEGNTEGKINWNHKEEEITFRHLKREEWRPEIYRLAKRAIKAIGLDFGAVDILADPTDDTLPIAVVCEINTAPALSPLGVKKYMKYFKRVVNEEFTLDEGEELPF